MTVGEEQGGMSAIALVVAYIIGTVVGASLRPHYSHIRDSVSALIEVGSPNEVLLDTMMGLHHLLLLPFGYGLHSALPCVKNLGWPADRAGIIGGAADCHRAHLSET